MTGPGADPDGEDDEVDLASTSRDLASTSLALATLSFAALSPPLRPSGTLNFFTFRGDAAAGGGGTSAPAEVGTASDVNATRDRAIDPSTSSTTPSTMPSTPSSRETLAETVDSRPDTPSTSSLARDAGFPAKVPSMPAASFAACCFRNPLMSFLSALSPPLRYLGRSACVSGSPGSFTAAPPIASASALARACCPSLSPARSRSRSGKPPLRPRPSGAACVAQLGGRCVACDAGLESDREVRPEPPASLRAMRFERLDPPPADPCAVFSPLPPALARTIRGCSGSSLAGTSAGVARNAIASTLIVSACEPPPKAFAPCADPPRCAGGLCSETETPPSSKKAPEKRRWRLVPFALPLLGVSRLDVRFGLAPPPFAAFGVAPEGRAALSGSRSRASASTTSATALGSAFSARFFSAGELSLAEGALFAPSDGSSFASPSFNTTTTSSSSAAFSSSSGALCCSAATCSRILPTSISASSSRPCTSICCRMLVGMCTARHRLVSPAVVRYS